MIQGQGGALGSLSLVPVSFILICAPRSGYICKVAYLKNPQTQRYGRTILQAVIEFQQLGLVGLREGGGEEVVGRGVEGGSKGEGKKERGCGLGWVEVLDG